MILRLWGYFIKTPNPTNQHNVQQLWLISSVLYLYLLKVLRWIALLVEMVSKY